MYYNLKEREYSVSCAANRQLQYSIVNRGRTFFMAQSREIRSVNVQSQEKVLYPLETEANTYIGVLLYTA